MTRRRIVAVVVAVALVAAAAAGVLLLTRRGATPPTGQTGHPVSSGRAQIHHVSGAHFPHVDVAPESGEHDQATGLPLPAGPARPKQQSPPTAVQMPPTGAVPGARLDAYRPLDVTSDPVTLFRNTTVPRGDNRFGEETSVAANDRAVLTTNNWGADVSTDGGRTFTYLDPSTVFPQTPTRYCCDQVATYIPSIDRLVWVIQYDPDGSGENLYRVAWASTGDFIASAGTSWTYADLTSQGFGITGDWMDYPDVSYDGGSLLLTAAVAKGGTTKVTGRQVLVRIGFSDLTGGAGSISYRYLVYADAYVYNFRIAEGCGSTTYWGSAINNSTLRIFHWDIAADFYSWTDVPVGSWKEPDFGAKDASGAWVDGSLTPDGQNWLFVSSSRIMGGALAGNELWFAWSAAKDSVYPTAHVETVHLNKDTFALDGQDAVWNSDFDTTMPALASNTDGEVGITFGFGGHGKWYPNLAVGFLTGNRGGVAAVIGTAGSQYWGDYVTVHRWAPNGELFAAFGFGITTTGDTPPVVVPDPHFVIFGRESVPMTSPTPTPAPTPTPRPTFAPATGRATAPVPTPPSSSPTQVVVRVTPLQTSYTCSSNYDQQPPFTVTIDNTGSSVTINWTAASSDTDTTGAPWAAFDPAAGMVGAGSTTTFTVTPTGHTCNFAGTRDFQITVTWTGGGVTQSATVTDAIKGGSPS